MSDYAEITAMVLHPLVLAACGCIVAFIVVGSKVA